MTKGERFKKVFDEIDVADYDALLGLLKFRRSVREFLRDPVSRELIEKILEAARYAPSGGNSQPWEFVVIEERETIQKLAELYEYQMVEKKWLEATREREMQMYPGDQFPGFEDQQAMNRFIEDVKGKAPFRNVPCMIFPLADDRWYQSFPLRTMLDKGHQHIISSLASAVFAMHLTASTLGLATQWVSDFGSPWLSGMTRHLLGIPQHCQIYEPMAVGFPAYYPKPRYVKPLNELVHYGKYDPAKIRTEEEIRDYILTHIRPKLKFKI